MGIFCEQSVEEAIAELKKRGDVQNKNVFWLKLSKATTDPRTGKVRLKAETLRKYINSETRLNEAQVAVVKDAAKKLNIELKLLNETATSYVMEPSFLNAEHIISPSDRTKNRVEPQEQLDGTHEVILRRGFMTVIFGRHEDEAAMYSAKFVADRCQIQIITKGDAEFVESKNASEGTPFRFLGNPEERSITQWDASGISSTHEVQGSLGTFSGSFTLMDKMIVLMDENDLKIEDVSKTIGNGPLSDEDIDDDLAKRINEQRKRVLKDAWKESQSKTDQNSKKYTLVVRPLLDNT